MDNKPHMFATKTSPAPDQNQSTPVQLNSIKNGFIQYLKSLNYKNSELWLKR